MTRSWILALLSATALVACSASNTGLPGGAEPGTGGSDAQPTGGTGGAGENGGDAGQGGAPDEQGGAAGMIEIGGSGPGPALDSLIYAHTDTELFQLDAKAANLSLKALGDFDCLSKDDPSMTDLAVDGQKNVWAVSASYVYRLELGDQTVHCAEKIKLKTASADVRYYGLTFAPAGVLDPDKEVLVAGNTAGELWAVDEGGGVTKVGTFGNVPKNDGNGNDYAKANVGKAWELSGDIVFLANEGNPVGYATARDCPKPPSTSGCNTTNTLIEIDVAKMALAKGGSVTKSVRGQIVERAGCTTPAFEDFGNMYGIAAWDDKVYAFSRTGNLVDVDVSDGTGCIAKAYPDFKFAGAGVTTLAPVSAPPPK
jgi:hypothetical protein